MSRIRLAVLATHPIQYYSPWFAHMASEMDLHVYYAYRQTPEGQAAAGFSTTFEWDLPLLEGYHSTFLSNIAKRPSVQRFWGCNTPEVSGLMRGRSYDALLMFGWNKFSFLQAWRAAHAAAIPVLIRLDSQLGSKRSRLKRAIKRPFYSFFLPRAADYLSPGRRSDAYLRHYRVPEYRIHRVPHMVDVDRFSAGAMQARNTGAAAALREKHGAAADEIVFLFVGKLITKKRPMLILDALSRLGSNAKAAVWMIGDGPLEGDIGARIVTEGLKVRRLGFVNQTELPTYYAAADCLLLPSNADETWGLVVNEAQASGIPAIVSLEAGCAPELIDEGVTGWVLQQAEPESLTQLMRVAIEEVKKLSPAPLEAKVRRSSYDEGTFALMETIERVTVRQREGCRAEAK